MNMVDKSRLRRRLATWLKRHKHLYSLYSHRFRYVTSPWRALPDWYILGAPKCATSSLYWYMVRHPDIDPGITKEPSFYYTRWEYGEYHYRSMFPMRRRGRLTGDASANYLAHPLPVAERAHEMTPDAKLIVMMRDPMDRAYSHYHMKRRRGVETEPTFERALELEAQRHAVFMGGDLRDDPWHMYMGHGDYEHHIERWKKWFPDDSILAIDFDEFIIDPHAVLARVWDHIGVKQVRLPDMEPRNVGRYPPRQSAKD